MVRLPLLEHADADVDPAAVEVVEDAVSINRVQQQLHPRRLGISETTVLIVYEAVVDDDRIAPGDRHAEVRRRLMMAVQ